MRVLIVISLAISVLSSGVVRALTGVGALGDRLSSGGVVEVVGKTAPWAEVVIVDPEGGDLLTVVAEVEQNGDFYFKFKKDVVTLNRLEIFGVDEAGRRAQRWQQGHRK